MIDIDYELDDRPCPRCGHHTTHTRTCNALNCEDGYIDEYEDDPLNFAPGEEYTICDECLGTGMNWWCPKCGADLTAIGDSETEADDDD